MAQMQDQNGYDDTPETTQQDPPPWWIQNDYHAPDREAVLKDPTRWGRDPTLPAEPKAKKTGDFWAELLASGGQTPDDLANFLKSSGWGEAGYTQGGKKRDMITDPQGKMWDAVFAAGLGGKGFQKLDPTQAANAGYGAATGTGAGAGAGAAGGFANMPAGMSDAIHRLLSRGFSTPSEMDPEIAGQFAPISRTIDRGAANTRQAAAERAAAGGSLIGGEGGSFDAGVNSINEQAGEQKGRAMGGLIGSELQARRQDIQTALQFAQGEEKMALEKQLAEADNEIRRQGMSQQNSQFYDDYGLRLAHENRSPDNSLDPILEALR